MKKIKYIVYSLSLILTLNACEQETIELKDKPCTDPAICPPVDTSCEDAIAGTADFTKFIAIGNSFVAGMQGGALFDAGQAASLPAILNHQFECVGASATFKQPDIGATLGWNLFVTQPFETDGESPIIGRMLLQYGDNTDCETGEPSPLPTPQTYPAGELEALPDPNFNPDFLYGGATNELNNFGVPAVTVGQLLTPATGNWADPDRTKGFTPFYARFASAPGASRIITDAAGAGGTFFLFWAGLDDFLLYAAFGADPTKAPLTSAADFQTRLGGALSPASPVGLLGLNPNIKGVMGNYPDIFKMPHFTSVVYNPIPLIQAQVDQLTAGFGGYNAALDGLIANKVAFGISDELAAEIATRKVFFEVSCNNKIMLIDETLTDLGPYFDGLQGAGAIDATQRAGLAPYEQVRHTTPTDVIPLAAGTVLGEPGTLGGLMGISEPLGDQYVIIPTEKAEIEEARATFNAIAAGVAQALTTRVAFADIDAALEGFTSAILQDGVVLTPNINPPTGIYSEDGLHFNNRGNAFIANAFIDAINSHYGATIPPVKLGSYVPTGLPIP